MSSRRLVFVRWPEKNFGDISLSLLMLYLLKPSILLSFGALSFFTLTSL
jgi:hypothetical protein